MTQLTTDLRFASATSDAADTKAALGQLVHELRPKLAGPIDLMMVFATLDHLDGFAMIHDFLAEALGPRTLAAATCEGVLGMQREYESGPAISVLAATMPGARVEPIRIHESDWPGVLDSEQGLAETLRLDADALRCAVLLPDAFSTPAVVKMLPMCAEHYPKAVMVGGMAGGSRKRGEGRLMIDGRIQRNGAVGLAIGGDIHVSTAVSQGCQPVGRSYIITRASNHYVQELGGQGVVAVIGDVIASMTDAERERAQTHGLLVGRVINEYKDRFGRGDFLIRSILGVDQEAGVMAVGDPDIRMGQTLQFHIRSPQTAETDLRLMLDMQKLHGPAAGALLFTCNGRGTRLFDTPDTDVKIVHDALGDVPLAGFFAAGEIGRVGDQSFVHGHTASMVLFRPTDQAVEA